MGSKKRVVVDGVDPGLSGALARVDAVTGALLRIEDMPSVDGRVNGALLRPWFDLDDGVELLAVGVEHVNGMKIWTPSTNFKLGGAWMSISVLYGFVGVRCIDHRATKWKKHYGISGDDQKDKALRLAIERWPDQAHAFKHKKDADRAEAALMAEFTRQQLLSEGIIATPGGDG